MFRITDAQGFHVLFENGWGVSVQFGPMHYCANRPPILSTSAYRRRRPGETLIECIQREGAEAGARGSANAEIAVLHPDGHLHQLPGWDDTVRGYTTPDELLRVMNWTARRDRWRNRWRRLRAALTRPYEFQIPPALLVQGRLLAAKIGRKKDA